DFEQRIDARLMPQTTRDDRRLDSLRQVAGDSDRFLLRAELLTGRAEDESVKLEVGNHVREFGALVRSAEHHYPLDARIGLARPKIATSHQPAHAVTDDVNRLDLVEIGDDA